jgi:hypothetical protein
MTSVNSFSFKKNKSIFLEYLSGCFTLLLPTLYFLITDLKPISKNLHPYLMPTVYQELAYEQYSVVPMKALSCWV